MNRRCVLLCIAALAAVAMPACSQVTETLGAIRAEHRRIIALNEEMESLARPGDRDPAALRDIRNRLRKEAESFRTVMRAFCGAETRHGLDEEIRLLHESFVTLLTMHRTYEEVVAGRTTTLTPEEREQVENDVKAFTDRELRDRMRQELKVQGLLEKLGERAFNEVVDAAVAQAEGEIFSLMDERLARMVDMALRGPDVIGSLMEEQARALVARKLATVFVRITSNELVIGWAAGVLVRWVGPKVKAILRPRGQLPSRTERSIETLRAAEMRLHALPGDAKISAVVAELDSAQDAIDEARFLSGDLERGSRRRNEDYARRAKYWLGKFEAQKARLNEVMGQTEERFLLDKRRYDIDCKEAERELAQLVEKLSSDTADDAGSGDVDGIEYVEFPPRYLIHIIETKTLGGPEKKDVWILFGSKPDENGVLLTPDDYGGVFVNKTDQVRGPFTNSHQLCPALKEAGLKGIWLGRRHIRCEPR